MAAKGGIVIVGGGHNGLVCAAYLARSGRSVLVLEAASQPGGAAVTDGFAPGFKVSTCAHLLHMLHPRVASDLNLAQHGLRFASRHMATVALDSGGEHLVLSDFDAAAKAVATRSQTDSVALTSLQRRMKKFARMLQPFLAILPPRLGSDKFSDRRTLIRMAWALRRLGRDDMRELMRIGAMNVADLLEDMLETELLRGALAFDAVLGTRLGPRSPNTVLTWLYRLAGEVGHTRDDARSCLALPEGGMGTVTDALANAAMAAGAKLRLGAPVARILVDDDSVSGVALESGETIAADTVISNADPRSTFLELLGTEHLDTGFVRRISNIQMRGAAAKLNLALDALPAFTGLDANALESRLLISPGIDYLERAYNHVKYGEHSESPAMEIIIPSIADPTLAPSGKHVLSAVVQYAPYDLKSDWDQAKEAFADRAIDIIAEYAPDIRERIVARQILTPLDLERDYRITGGHWHHGELGFDQLFMLRPVPGAAQYATPLQGLFLCGAGSHPGGGVMGAAGMNAARQVMAMEAR
jgi:phytoene dehydrogenase-like protein